MVVVVEGEDFPLEPLNLELIADAKTSAATVFSRALIQKGADMSGRHVSTLATTLIASPLGESLATHLASASLLKMRASLINTAVLQESGPIPGYPPQSHSRTRLRRYANGSTGGKSSSPHQDAIFHFARILSHWLSNSYLKAGGRCASRRRGRTAMEVQSLFCRPLGRTSPESHPRQRRPPTVLPTTRWWLFAFARFVRFVQNPTRVRRVRSGRLRLRGLGGPLHGPLFEGPRTLNSNDCQ